MAKWLRIALLLGAAVLAAEWWSTHAPPDAPAADEPAAAAPATAPSSRAPPGAAPAAADRYPSFLPPEAIDALEAIEHGGPFPYDRDGTVFQNRERRLPDRPRGYYREYTVATPGARDRGARRIVAGGQPPEVYYYTDDHYRTFRRVEVAE